MGIPPKYKRKIKVAGREYLWYVCVDDEMRFVGAPHLLNVLTADRSFFVRFHLGLPADQSHLTVICAEFRGIQMGPQWRRFACPEFVPSGNVTPKNVADLIEWSTRAEALPEELESDWRPTDTIVNPTIEIERTAKATTFRASRDVFPQGWLGVVSSLSARRGGRSTDEFPLWSRIDGRGYTIWLSEVGLAQTRPTIWQARLETLSPLPHHAQARWDQVEASILAFWKTLGELRNPTHPGATQSIPHI